MKDEPEFIETANTERIHELAELLKCSPQEVVGRVRWLLTKAISDAVFKDIE